MRSKISRYPRARRGEETGSPSHAWSPPPGITIDSSRITPAVEVAPHVRSGTAGGTFWENGWTGDARIGHPERHKPGET
jgi:hypothetical protein